MSRLKTIVLALAVLVPLSSPSWAQAPTPTQPPPPTDRTKATRFSAEELRAALGKLPTDRPSAAVRVFSLAPYNVNVEQRQPRAQGASLHEAQAELFYVIEGSATLLTGGTLTNPTRTGTNQAGPGHRQRRAHPVQQGRLPDRAVGGPPPVRGHRRAGPPDVDLPAEYAAIAGLGRRVGAGRARRAILGSLSSRACLRLRHIRHAGPTLTDLIGVTSRASGMHVRPRIAVMVGVEPVPRQRAAVTTRSQQESTNGNQGHHQASRS